MWKMPAKECIKTRLVAASAVKRVLTFGIDFRFAPPLTLKMFRQIETPIGYYAAIFLNYRNVAKHLGREPQIIKFENAFHIPINIGYIYECTLSAMSSNTSVRILQTATYNRNFIVLLLLSSRISLNWFPTASGVLLMVSLIIYFNTCNCLDIIIFRL